MKDLNSMTRSWLTRLWALLILVFVPGTGSVLKAASDFATTSYNTVSHKPSITEPYIVVRMLFYDAKGSDSFFTHYKADGTNKGPAVYVDGNYICSPDWELAWPGGDGDNGGDGSDGYVADECWDNDEWWGYTYTKKVNGVNYTIKFWNPVRDSDDRRYVYMYVFMDKFLCANNHTVKVKGRWRTNGSSPVAVNKEFTWTVNGFTMGVEGPSSIAMNGIGKMILSGNLRSQAYGAFTVSTSDNYTTSSMIDNAPSKKEFSKGAGSFSNVELNCYNRSNYYDSYSTHIQYSVSGNVSVNGFNTNVKIYQWYSTTIPGYVKPSNLNVSTNNMWTKKVKLTWDYAGTNNNTNGVWNVYRYPANRPAERECVVKDISFNTRTATITAPDWDVNYTYEVAFIPSNNERRNELTVSKNHKVARDWSFNNVKAGVDEADESKIKLTWEHASINDASGTNGYTLTIQRSADYNAASPKDAIWEDLTTQSVTSNETTKGTYSDGKGLVSKKSYYYRLRVNIMGVDVYSDIASGNLGGSKILDFKVSRGTYNNIVKLQWQVKQVGDDQTNFSIQRRPFGRGDDQPWAEIYTTSGTAESYSYDDVTAQPGTFNQYKVVIWSKDNNNRTEYGDYQVKDGFSLSSGIISGNINYGTGVAVPNVKVKLERQNTDGNSVGGLHSLQFSGSNKGLVYESDSTTLSRLMGGDFSVQMYLNPDNNDVDGMNINTGHYQLFNVLGAFEFQIKYYADRNGYMPVVYGTNGNQWATPITIPANEWSHLSFVYKRSDKTLDIYLTKDDSIISHHVLSDLEVDMSKLATTKMGITRNGNLATINRTFRGFLDEFRFFTKALTKGDILNNYNHPLAGSESALAIYYPLDEGMPNQIVAYDFSKTDGIPNGRHATTSAAVGSNDIPTENQLSLMAYTDSLGYFEVRGVPFAGEGTSYSVVPQLGIHEFSPSRQSRYVSQSSLIHNSVDFQDVSSFPVSGKILYQGTTYPVDGANIYVDGTICAKNGEVITTNENGEFTVSVPIGKHFIEVKKNGHEFLNEGRYPADPNHTGNEFITFDEEKTGLKFTDVTLVNFSGRLVGGDIENSYPVGFALSHNNIGVTNFTLTPLNTNPYLNALDTVMGGVHQYMPNTRTVEVKSATNRIQSKAWRGKEINDCRTIFVETDSLTGEFSVMVPPLEYAIGDMKGKYSKLPIDCNVTVDLTNPTHEYSDTLVYDDGTYELYTYNSKLDYPIHNDPYFTVTQKGRDDGSFGIDEYEFSDALRKEVIKNIYSVSNGQVTYNYGETGHKAPLFLQGKTYSFLLDGYELYKNYDVNPDRPVESKVPLKNVVVSINNALSADQAVWLVDGDVNLNGKDYQAEAGKVKDLQSNQLQLDNDGKATYKWTVGLPNVASPYTRNISISYEISGRTYQWDGNGMEGIILGDLPSGNNFVTSGPDKLLMVLRDPPGSYSSAEWSEGTVTSTATTKNDVWSDEVSAGCTFKFGLKSEFITGTAVGAVVAISTKTESADDLTTTAVMENEGEKGNSIETSTTITRTVATSGEPDFVGADGDIFVGQATNIIFGNARHVGFERSENGFKLGKRDVISTGVDFKTTFYYTQSYIENTLIPNYELMRKSVLKYATAADLAKYNPSNGVGMHNDGASAGNYYFTSLTPDSANFGEPGTYTVIIPKPTKAIPSDVKTPVDLFQWCIKEGYAKSDTIEWINSQIENWQNYLAFNEEEKVKAYEQRKDEYSTNHSFDGGSSVNYSIETDSTHTSSWDWVVKAGAVIGNHTGFEVSGFGMDFDVEVSAMGGRHESKDVTDETVTSFSYTLADEGSDAITVDVYNYGSFGPIFRTRGGQTSNPYEGNVETKYYKPGTTIMEATMQIEVPTIGIKDDEMADVPSGSAANYELYLGNMSEIGEDVAYRLFVLDETNPDGAQISIDGMVLTEGRLIKVPGSQTVTKSLQLRQTNLGVLDYFGCMNPDNELYKKGIAIVFASDSQPEEIADTIYIKARFVPSSSPVSLALSNRTVNTQTGTELVMTLKDYDRHYNNQKFFRLQYKKPGSVNWTQLKEYYVDKKYKTENNEELPGGGTVDFTKDLASMSDGNYLFRAVSVASFGNDDIYTYSEEIPLVKDMMTPRPLGTPEPSDGVLDIGDDMSITFNEDIVKGALNKDNNFTISAVLNGARVAHETALSMKGSGNIASTDANILLAGKDFSIDMWAYLGAGGTILSHGNGTNKLTLGVTDNGKMLVNIGGVDCSEDTDPTIPMNEWVFLSLSYKNAKNGGILNLAVADEGPALKVMMDRKVPAYKGNGTLAVGSINNSAIHELLLWDEAHNMETALLNRSFTKSPSTRHLIGYWKMNEGEGTQIRDYSRNRHMTMADETWYLNNVNKAVSLDGASYLAIDGSRLPIYPEDDYAVEFWMRGGAQAGDAQLIQMGDVALWINAAGELQLTGKGAYNDAEAQTVATSAVGLNDNAWHHIALNVLRQGSATVYADGKRCLTVNSSNVGSIVTNSIIVGARRVTEGIDLYTYTRPFNGTIDEIRIWNATMNADLLASNRKVRFTGKELGLAACYSFEKDTLDEYSQKVTLGDDADLTGSGLKIKKYALGNSQQKDLTYADDAPALRTKPTETNVEFEFTASNDKIVIEITEKPAAIEGCTLNFAVRDVPDENGNYLKTAKWSAFVNRKQIEWEDDVLSLEQPVKAEGTITAKIINKGGQQQSWSLSGIPAWLEASADYGVTNARSESKVTFTVKPSTPIGKYEETIYLTGNDGIDVPLTLNVKVTGNEPDWSVNAKKFENSMSIIGSLDILGVMSDDEDDIVAAFIGDECRGVAHPVYKERYDGYYVTMDIYGSSDDKAPLTFRAYDASTGTLYPEVNASPATAFQELTLKGTYADPVQLTAVDKIEQTIQLKEGWNWVSLYVKADAMTVASLLAQVADDVVTIKSQNAYLSFESGTWGGDLTGSLTNGQMYAVLMKADRTLRLVGARVEPSSNPVTIYNGWNWIGYYGRQVSDVTDALADLIPDDGNIIKGQSGVAYYDTYEWSGSLAMLEPGEGYKLNVALGSNEAKTFSYPSAVVNPAPSRNRIIRAPAKRASGTFQPVDFRIYSGNATMAVKVLKDNAPLANAEVGVFAAGECRAAAVTNSAGIAYLTIPGDDAVELTFKVADGTEVTDIPGVVNYQTDAIYGSPKNPVLFGLGDITGIGFIESASAGDDEYDLMGRKATESQKGIRIRNGRKTLKK